MEKKDFINQLIDLYLEESENDFRDAITNLKDDMNDVLKEKHNSNGFVLQQELEWIQEQINQLME